MINREYGPRVREVKDPEAAAYIAFVKKGATNAYAQ